MKSKEIIEQTVAQALEAQGYELVDLIIQNQGSKKLLQFFADKAGGFTLADCELLTNKIDAVLEMENLIEGAYVLEVSSPGIRRVIKKAEHYKRFEGERVKLFTKQPIENRGVFTGIITLPTETGFTLDDGTNKIPFKYEDIKKANLDPVVEF